MLEEEEDGLRWTVLWAGAMAVLRTVGHVLRSVDGASPAVPDRIEAANLRWKAERLHNAVFWEFIEQERNNVLKEYRLNLEDSAEVAVVVVEDAATSRSASMTEETPFAVDENMFRPVKDGFAAGADARDVYRDAVAWWNAELSRIETEVSR